MTQPAERVTLSFLLLRVDGFGGVPRTVLNLANAMVEHLDVRLISVSRQRNKPTFDIDPRVEVDYLIDQRPVNPRGRRSRGGPNKVDETSDPRYRERADRLRRPSQLVPSDSGLNEESDRVLPDALAALAPGILVPTRPSLNLLAGRYTPEGVTLVGQDHLNFRIRTSNPQLTELMREAVRRLDAFVPLTQGDADDYRAMMPDADTEITAIPNALSWPMGERAPLTEPVVVAAGRLKPQKAFNRLIDAFAPVARQRPDWRLNIYGGGEDEEKLRARIDALGVGEQVELKGYTRELPQVFSRSSVYAMSSIYEGFPMVLLEAMTTGLPMIAYDCPRGPAELIRDGENGLLIPDGDSDAYTAGLLHLIDDADLRRAMGAVAWQDAHLYQLPTVVDRWLDLFRRVHPPFR